MPVAAVGAVLSSVLGGVQLISSAGKMPIHLKYKLAEQANVSTRMAYVEDKNTEAQRTQSYPSHLPSVTSVPLCFKSASPVRIAISVLLLASNSLLG